MALSKSELEENTLVACAAHNLIVALDETFPTWREETLGKDHEGVADWKVNWAWDELIEALEASINRE